MGKCIQNITFNRSRIGTVVIRALASNLRGASARGNALLEPGEANQPKQGIVNVSQVFTVDMTDLGEYIKNLFRKLINEMLAEIKLRVEVCDVDPVS